MEEKGSLYIVNLYGGPGSGKSTTAAGVFHLMKKLKKESPETSKFNVELVTEFAKDKVYDLHSECLNNQFYTSANQHHRMWRVINYYVKNNFNKQDCIIITDSPVLTGLFYDTNPDEKARKYLANLLYTLGNFNEFKDYFKSIEIINYIIKRNVEYFNEGRLQSSDESDEITSKIQVLFKNNKIPFDEITTTEGTDKVFNSLKEKYNKESSDNFGDIGDFTINI